MERFRLSDVLITSTKLNAVGDIMLATRCVGTRSLPVGNVVFGRCRPKGVVRRSGVTVYRCVANLPIVTGMRSGTGSLSVSTSMLTRFCSRIGVG